MVNLFAKQCWFTLSLSNFAVMHIPVFGSKQAEPSQGDKVSSRPVFHWTNSYKNNKQLLCCQLAIIK